jgi:hypothetical protein
MRGSYSSANASWLWSSTPTLVGSKGIGLKLSWNKFRPQLAGPLLRSLVVLFDGIYPPTSCTASVVGMSFERQRPLIAAAIWARVQAPLAASPELQRLRPAAVNRIPCPGMIEHPCTPWP